MCPEIRVINPYPNPRRKKSLSRDQVEKMQRKAVQFLRDVVDDPERADEIEDLSIGEYADRRGIEVNPTKRKGENMARANDVLQKIDELKAEVSRLRRSNPNGNGQPKPATTAATTNKSSRLPRKVLDRLEDAQAAIDDGNADEAWDIIEGIFDGYEEEGGDDED